MTREAYIEAVKAKLEEISPFDEPMSFIADSDSEQNTVKPIVSYIDTTLDEAVRNCLRSLPLSLLHADIERMTSVGQQQQGKILMEIDKDCVGTFTIGQQVRLVRFRHDALKRDITAFITTEDPAYLLQQSKWVRGGVAKPVGVWSSNEHKIEIYSFPETLAETADNTAILLGIRINKHAASRSHDEYIIITDHTSRYYRFGGGKPTDEYDGTTYGKRVAGIWYRGWRTDVDEEVYTLGDDTPVAGATVYEYSNGAMISTSGYTVVSYTSNYVDSDYVHSPIEDYIVLECAAMVSDILGNTATAKACRDELQTKLAAELQ